MSAQRVEDIGTVASMREFLSDALEEAEAFERDVREHIRRLKDRLSALELAEDPEFQAEVQDLYRQVCAAERLEDLGPVYNQDELADLFASRKP